MKEKIGRCLMASGFVKLELQFPGITVYYAIENNFINAIILTDIHAEPELTAENYDMFTRKIDWRTGNGESIDVHTLSLIFTPDMEAARKFAKDNSFCWYVDIKQNRLLVEEGKCEDFYGMRTKIENCILSPDIEESEELPEDLPKSGQVQPEEDRNLGADYQVKRQALGISSYNFVNYGLIFVNVLIFILCIFAGDFFYNKGIFDLKSVLEEGQWYRLLTSTFLHANASHLVSNMLYLYLLGDMVEKTLGHVKYFFMYIGSGLIASAFSMGFSYMVQDYTQSLGASGAVFGVTGALFWIALRNRGGREVITIPKIIFLIAYSLYNGFVGTNIDNAAHVGGLIGGFLLTMVLYRKKKNNCTQQSEKREEEDA